MCYCFFIQIEQTEFDSYKYILNEELDVLRSIPTFM